MGNRVSAEAIEWLEDDHRLERLRRDRHNHSHQRPMIQVMTDHEWSTDGTLDGMSELDIVRDAWGEFTPLRDICGICGDNPIILGAGNVDSA